MPEINTRAQQSLLADKTTALDNLIRGIKPNTDGTQWATGLDTVQGLRMIRETADSALVNAVALARSEGESWESIGRALGMTRQAAHEKYAA